MNWRDDITIDPEVGHRRECITDTGVLMGSVLGSLAAGPSREAVCA